MARYKKGSNAERELIQLLYEKGFSVLRAAGSGKSSLPAPDVIALNREKRLAFECKAWDASYLSISVEQFEEQLGWCDRAGADFVIAWKMPRTGFVFVNAKDLVKTPKAYAISREKALKKGMSLEILLGEQSRLKV